MEHCAETKFTSSREYVTRLNASVRFRFEALLESTLRHI